MTAEFFSIIYVYSSVFLPSSDLEPQQSPDIAHSSFINNFPAPPCSPPPSTTLCFSSFILFFSFNLLASIFLLRFILFIREWVSLGQQRRSTALWVESGVTDFRHLAFLPLPPRSFVPLSSLNPLRDVDCILGHSDVSLACICASSHIVRHTVIQKSHHIDVCSPTGPSPFCPLPLTRVPLIRNFLLSQPLKMASYILPAAAALLLSVSSAQAQVTATCVLDFSSLPVHL